MRKELEGLDIPVLVLHGTDDQIVPFETGGKAAMKHLKKGRFEVFEGEPHALPARCAEKVNKLVEEFVKE